MNCLETRLIVSSHFCWIFYIKPQKIYLRRCNFGTVMVLCSLFSGWVLYFWFTAFGLVYSFLDNYWDHFLPPSVSFPSFHKFFYENEWRIGWEMMFNGWLLFAFLLTKSAGDSDLVEIVNVWSTPFLYKNQK